MKSIKSKGIIFSLCIILFAILPLGLGGYFRFRKILVNEVNQAVVRVAEETADHLSSYISQFISPLVKISKNELIISMDWEKQKDILVAQIHPNYLQIVVVDINGMAHYTDGTILDLSDRDYIQQTLTGKLSFSDVIISRKTGEHVIMLSVPIFRDGIVQGALIARLDEDFLSDFASTRGYGENGRAYVISDQGAIISRSRQENENKMFNIHGAAYNDDNYAQFSEFVHTTSHLNSGFGSFEFHGQRILMGYASVEKINWKVYIGTVEEEALKSLNDLLKAFNLIIVLSLILCAILAWVIVQKLLKPIVELDNLFSKGAMGNLTVRFSGKSKDEIGRLGLSFNRMMDKIKTLTQYDSLTALMNQYVLEKEIQNLTHLQQPQKFSIIMVAIDKLSHINDTYGYEMGDLVLCEMASRIKSCITPEHQLYRYKGDEFIILARNSSDHEIQAMAQKILSLLIESYHLKGKNIEVKISIGIFHANEDTQTEEPLKSVTNALNYAKFLGSNQIQAYNPQLHANLLGIRELQSEIPLAIREDQLYLVYQPIMELESNKMVGVEALVRWKHPRKGILYPDKFIDLAEQNGTIVELDFWVIKTVCKLIKSWQDENRKPVGISVNISARTFESKRFIPDLLDILKQYRVDPELIQLEITERMVIHNIEESIVKLNELREMGVHIAIDDFGIGYSSLSYIIRLPIDSIKIDKAFVQSMSTSLEARVLVAAIISLCKTLKYNVIAEGIETLNDLEYLKKNKCAMGQGYYFSKPVHIKEIHLVD
ncbi:MAG: EAL domain-containing protein [Ruminiclostridium sp.]|nr:EAL domain-containing protein [Ruminiclostridium sp.]